MRLKRRSSSRCASGGCCGGDWGGGGEGGGEGGRGRGRGRGGGGGRGRVEVVGWGRGGVGGGRGGGKGEGEKGHFREQKRKVCVKCAYRRRNSPPAASTPLRAGSASSMKNKMRGPPPLCGLSPRAFFGGCKRREKGRFHLGLIQHAARVGG